MKRVLLLVFLMVSLVELDLERYRIYLFCSTAALAGLLCNVLMSRRKAKNIPETRALDDANGYSCLSTEQSEVACASRSIPSDDSCENGGSAQNTLREVALMHNKST